MIPDSSGKRGREKRERKEEKKGHLSQALRFDSNFIWVASRAQQHSSMASTTESSSTVLHGGLSHSGCSSWTATHNDLQVLLGDSQIHGGPWPLLQQLHSSSLILNGRAHRGGLSHRGCSSSAAPTFTAARDSIAAPDLLWRLLTAATSHNSHSGSQPISLSAEPSERPRSSPVSSPSRPLTTFSSSYTLVRPREGSAKLTFLPTSTNFFSSSSRSSQLAASSRRSKTPTSYHLFSFQPFITKPSPLPPSLCFGPGAFKS